MAAKKKPITLAAAKKQILALSAELRTVYARLKDFECAEHDVAVAARLRRETQDAERNAIAQFAAVSEARDAMQAADSRMTAVNSAIRQQNYELRLMLDMALKRGGLPESEAERIQGLLNKPRPSLENLSPGVQP